jgi:hypothetical protein
MSRGETLRVRVVQSMSTDGFMIWIHSSTAKVVGEPSLAIIAEADRVALYEAKLSRLNVTTPMTTDATPMQQKAVTLTRRLTLDDTRRHGRLESARRRRRSSQVA